MKITNCAALVTGASRGIGASLVRALADRGAHRVYAAARRPESLPEITAPHRDVIVPLALGGPDPGTISPVMGGPDPS